MRLMVRKFIGKQILANPDDYFTPEVMQALEETANRSLVMVDNKLFPSFPVPVILLQFW